MAGDPKLAPEVIAELANRFLKDELDAYEAWLAKSPWEDYSELDREMKLAERYAEGALELLKISDWSAISEIVDECLAEAGMQPMRGQPGYHDLCRAFLRANAEFGRRRLARLQGRYDLESGDPLFTKAGPLVSSIKPASETRPAPTGPLLSEIVQAHIASATWTAQTLAQNKNTLELFREHTGDKPLAAVSRRDISEFLDSLRRLPSKYGQLPRYRNKSLVEMLVTATSESPDVPRLTQKTINRHAAALSGLFKWAEEHGRWEGKNPASGFVKKGRSLQSRGRREWQPEELRRLFSSPVWKEEFEGRGSRFYVPLLGLFAGLRLDEACKLQCDEVRPEGDFWVIEIKFSPEGRVKDRKTERAVPVHPTLCKIGFIDYVIEARRRGQEILWPEINKSGPDQKRSATFTKWFSRYCQKIGLKPRNRPGEPLLDFHSLRHNLGAALRRAGVTETHASDILGHSYKRDTYRTYSHGPDLHALYQELAKVDFGVDLSHLYKRF